MQKSCDKDVVRSLRLPYSLLPFGMALSDLVVGQQLHRDDL